MTRNSSSSSNTTFMRMNKEYCPCGSSAKYRSFQNRPGDRPFPRHWGIPFLVGGREPLFRKGSPVWKNMFVSSVGSATELGWAGLCFLEIHVPVWWSFPRDCECSEHPALQPRGKHPETTPRPIRRVETMGVFEIPFAWRMLGKASSDPSWWKTESSAHCSAPWVSEQRHVGVCSLEEHRLERNVGIGVFHCQGDICGVII